MKALLIGVILSCSLWGGMLDKKWEYLIFYKGVEYDNKSKKLTHINVLNNGDLVSVGKATTDPESKANMLKKYFKEYQYDKAYKINVLSLLGHDGWEMVSLENDKGSETMYFKRNK